MTRMTTGFAVLGAAMLLASGASMAAQAAPARPVAQAPLPLVAGAPVARVVVRAKRPDADALVRRTAPAPVAKGAAPCPARAMAG